MATTIEPIRQTQNAPQNTRNINLVLLLQTGQRTVLPCHANQSISTVKSSLLQTWPHEFGDTPMNAAQIRLIHGGKLLLDSQALVDLAVDSDTVVMHISVRPHSVPEVSGVKQDKKGRCCVVS